MKKVKLILAIILVLNVMLRLPALFEPVSYGDECIYLTLGQAMLKGLVFYRDIHDNKPPLLYLVSALTGGQLYWLKLLMIIWNTINVFLLYRLGKWLYQSDKAGLLAGFLFTVFSLLPEGRIANGEIFMILPATLGVFLGLKAWQANVARRKQINNNRLWLAVGVCFSLAFLFKVPILFDFIGFLLALFFFTKKKLLDCFQVFKEKRFWLVLVGFGLPILLSIAYYSLKGAFTPYVRSALMQNIGYLKSWGGGNQGLFYRGGILLVVMLIIWHHRHQLGVGFFLPAILSLFGLYGVFLSQRPYPHYLLEVVPWLALLITAAIFGKQILKITITVLLLGLLIVGMKKYQFWWYPHLPYYRNFLSYTLGRISREEFFRFFGAKTLTDYKVAKSLKIISGPQDRIFVWGDGACIYALANRLPAGRYTVKYHIDDFSGLEETMRSIEDKRPADIVILEPLTNFPSLEQWLPEHYAKISSIDQVAIYHYLNFND